MNQKLTVRTLLSLSLLFLVLNIQAQLQDYRWTSVETVNKPTGRHENTFIKYKDQFILLGGRGIKAVEFYNPETNTWTSKGETPMEIHHFQAVVIDDAVYILGAMTGRYPKELPIPHIWIYYPDTDTWKKGADIPTDRQRGGAGTVLYKGKIYTAGGIKFGHTSGTTNMFDCYDPKTDEWTVLTDAPHIRDHFPAIMANNKMYCIGGRNTSVHYPKNFGAFFSATIPEVDYYDFEAKKWFTIEAPLPYPTAAGGLVQLDSCLVYMGGEGSQLQAYNQTQCLNLNTHAWSQLSPLTIGRHGSGAILHNDCIYKVAGSSNKGGGNMNSLEVFSSDHQWHSLFNGTNLDGWEVKCIAKDKESQFWSVEDGAIVCNSLHSNTHNYVWLQTEESYDNYELRLKFQVSRLNKGNSGVQVHSKYDAEAVIDANEKGWLDGPQVDIHPKNPFRTGLIYDETRNAKRWIYPDLPNWTIKPQDVKKHKVRFYYEDEETGWNDMTITCKGTNIKTMVNNVVVADYDGNGILNDSTHQQLGVGQSGHIALQLHKKNSNLIRFKDIEIRPLD